MCVCVRVTDGSSKLVGALVIIEEVECLLNFLELFLRPRAAAAMLSKRSDRLQWSAENSRVSRRKRP